MWFFFIQFILHNTLRKRNIYQTQFSYCLFLSQSNPAVPVFWLLITPWNGPSSSGWNLHSQREACTSSPRDIRSEQCIAKISWILKLELWRRGKRKVTMKFFIKTSCVEAESQSFFNHILIIWFKLCVPRQNYKNHLTNYGVAAKFLKDWIF